MRTSLRFCVGACLAIATAMIATSAAAPIDQQITRCSNDDGRYPPDAAIKACGAILQSLKNPRITMDQRLKLEAETLKYRAKAYLDKKDYDHAIADCTAAIADYAAIKDPKVVSGPLVAGAFAVRGAVYLDIKKDYDRAIDDETQAIKFDPNNAAWYSERGAAYFQRAFRIVCCNISDLDRDIADETQAIRLDPDNARYYVGRAIAYREKSETDKALADFDRAIALSPKNVLFLSQRAQTYLQKKDYDRAFADYDAAIALEPKNAELWADRCDAKLSKHAYSDALADCNQAIRLDPNDSYAFSVRALVKAFLGDRAGSDQDSARANAIDAQISK